MLFFFFFLNNDFKPFGRTDRKLRLCVQSPGMKGSLVIRGRQSSRQKVDISDKRPQPLTADHSGDANESSN